MGEFSKNLWAPWRMEYIDELTDPNEENKCFLCAAADVPENDTKSFVLTRGEHCFVILNRFPYTSGHLLIAPYKHTGDLNELSDETMLEMMQTLKKMQNLLKKALGAEGFNVGVNLERCSGAGLPDHIHMHIVPRWSGDTNFMSILDGVRVIPQAIEKTFLRLKDHL